MTQLTGIFLECLEKRTSYFNLIRQKIGLTLLDVCFTVAFSCVALLKSHLVQLSKEEINAAGTIVVITPEQQLKGICNKNEGLPPHFLQGKVITLVNKMLFL